MDTLKKAFTSYKSNEDKSRADLAKALKTRRHLKYHKKFKRDKVDYLKRQKLDSLLYNTTNMVNVTLSIHIQLANFHNRKLNRIDSVNTNKTNLTDRNMFKISGNIYERDLFVKEALIMNNLLLLIVGS